MPQTGNAPALSGIETRRVLLLETHTLSSIECAFFFFFFFLSSYLLVRGRSLWKSLDHSSDQFFLLQVM